MLLDVEVREGVSTAERDKEEEEVTPAVSEGNGIPLAVLLPVNVIDGVPDFKGEFEGLAPTDKDDVGVLETDCESDRVGLGVIDDVDVPLIVADDVGVLEAVDELVILSEFELLAGVFEGLEPRLIDADDEKEIEALRVMVDEAVCEDVTVPETVALAVGVADGVAKAVDVDDGVIRGDTVALNDIEGELLAEPPELRVLVGDVVIVEDRLAASDSLSLPELVPDGVELDVLELVPVDELVGLFEGEFDVV